MREYKHQGETFQLDDSKGCYVTVTYKHLTGYVGVNLGKKASPQNPYAWYTAREIGGADCVTPDGLKFGIAILRVLLFKLTLMLCAFSCCSTSALKKRPRPPPQNTAQNSTMP